MNGQERVLRQALACHGICPLPWASIIDMLDTLQEIQKPSIRLQTGGKR